MWAAKWLLLSALSALSVSPVCVQASASTGPIFINLDYDFFGRSSYGVEAAIGTPANTFNLRLDTTFPHITVGSVTCENCQSTARFDRQASSTFRLTGDYSGWNVSGLIGVDEVGLVGDDRAKVLRTPLLLIDNDPTHRLTPQRQGLFGLAPTGPKQTYPSFLENLKIKRVISEAVIAVFIGRYTKQSSMSFGGSDLSQFSTRPNFIYLDANTTNGLWEFTLSEAAYGSVTLETWAKRAIIDSSSDKLGVPNSVFTAIKTDICRKIQCVNDTESVQFLCKRTPKLSNLSFSLNGIAVVITPDDFFNQDSKGKYAVCSLAMYGNDGEDWVLGIPFMQAYYLLFDYDNGQVGLAPANQDESYTWLYWVLGIAAGLIVVLIAVICYAECDCCLPQLAGLKERLLG